MSICIPDFSSSAKNNGTVEGHNICNRRGTNKTRLHFENFRMCVDDNGQESTKAINGEFFFKRV